MDIWQSLDKNTACETVSNITDISDIFNFSLTSRNFLQYSNCIKNLTSDKLVNISGGFIFTFQYVVTIDHKIIIIIDESNINNLKLLNKLEQAHFLIQNLNLLSPLLQVVNKLNDNTARFYFKISLLLPDITIGIFIMNNKYLILPRENNNYDQILSQTVSQINPNSFRMTFPDLGTNRNAFILIKKPMRDFLKNEDFGLLDPKRPPSETNPPLSNYTRIIANSGGFSYKLISIIFYTYLYYNQLPKLGIVNFNQTLRKYFSTQIEVIRKGNPGINMSAMNVSDITSLLSFNMMFSISVEDIAEFEFPDTFTANQIENISNNVPTSITYHSISQDINNPGTAFYKTDGNLKYM